MIHSGSETILTSASLLKMMKNAFYFMLRALFLLLRYFSYIFALTFWLGRKPLNEKAKVDFKIYDVTERTTNNCITCIAQYVNMQTQSGHEIWSVNEI